MYESLEKAETEIKNLKSANEKFYALMNQGKYREAQKYLDQLEPTAHKAFSHGQDVILKSAGHPGGSPVPTSWRMYQAKAISTTMTKTAKLILERIDTIAHNDVTEHTKHHQSNQGFKEGISYPPAPLESTVIYNLLMGLNKKDASMEAIPFLETEREE